MQDTTKDYKPYVCYHCGKSFSHLTVYKKHLKSHKGKNFVCDICQKSFTFKCNMTAHRRIHDAQRAFSCKVCGKAYNYKDKLKSHIQIHPGWTDVKLHVPQEEKKKTPTISCDICGKSFKFRCILKQHMNIHDEKRAFLCRFCKRGFNYKANLKAHLLCRHAAEKACLNEGGAEGDIVCPVCHERFTSVRALPVHLRSHKFVDKVKPYLCNVCDEKFSDSTDMSEHLKEHIRSCGQITSVLSPVIRRIIAILLLKKGRFRKERSPNRKLICIRKFISLDY